MAPCKLVTVKNGGKGEPATGADYVPRCAWIDLQLLLCDVEVILSCLVYASLDGLKDLEAVKFTVAALC